MQSPGNGSNAIAKGSCLSLEGNVLQMPLFYTDTSDTAFYSSNGTEPILFKWYNFMLGWNGICKSLVDKKLNFKCGKHRFYAVNFGQQLSCVFTTKDSDSDISISARLYRFSDQHVRWALARVISREFSCLRKAIEISISKSCTRPHRLVQNKFA